MIDKIREHDNKRIIVAVGNVGDIAAWTPTEQAAFRRTFFRTDTGLPANVLMNEQYILGCDTNTPTESEIQTRLGALTGSNGSLDRTRDMVNAARGETPPRKAEWYHIINVNNEYRCGDSCWTGTGDIEHGPSLRRPIPAELSVQAYMALARGATGIVYYSHTTNGLATLSDACIDEELGTRDPLSAISNCIEDFDDNCDLDANRRRWYFGLMRFSPDDVQMRTPSPMDTTVQTVNQKLKIIGDELYPVKHQPLTWDANYDNFSSTNGLSATTLVDAVWPNGSPSSTAAGKLEFGQFHNDEADYVLVVNRLTQSAQTIDLRFDVAQMASVDVGGGSFQIEDVSVSSVTPVIVVADANGNVTVSGQSLAAGAARLYRIEWFPTLRVQWVFDGAHLFAQHHARLTWDDPGNSAITGWEYQQKEGNSAWGSPQEASSTASTVTKVVSGLNSWQTYRFKVRARYGTGVDDTGPESAEAVLSPWLEFTQAPTVGLLGGDGMAQFEVGIDRPVDMPDLPEGSLRISPENLQVQVVTVAATGETTESDFVALASIGEVLQGAALVETSSETDLPPVEPPAAGASGADDQTASPQVVTSIRVSGLDPGVTYRFKVRLLRPDGVTGPADSASVLGLRWQRRTGEVELSWSDPDIPAGRAWEYRQQAGRGSWGLWRSVRGSTGSTTTHTVSGLREAVTYRFQVRAIGPGGPFAESFTVSAPVGPPDAPRHLTAVAGDRQLTLSWERPANNGSPLTRYQHRRSVDGGATWSPDWSRQTIIPRSDSTTTSHVFGGLTNGTAYTFDIRALNGPAQVTATPLGPPANLRAAPGDGQVTLSWDDPSPANATIAEWQYRSKRSRATAWGPWQTEDEATARQVTVGSLEHGHAYQFEVRAINSSEDEGPVASASAVLYRVKYNTTIYVLIEGGEPVAPQTGRHEVDVQVLLTPRALAPLLIPLTVGGTKGSVHETERPRIERGPADAGLGRIAAGPTAGIRPLQQLDQPVHAGRGAGHLPRHDGGVADLQPILRQWDDAL